MKPLFKAAMAALPLVAILRGITPGEVEAVGDALVVAGFRIVEIPLTSFDPFLSIARLVERLGPDVIVGAGTVRRVDQLDEMIAAGGRLMVTPHADTTLIRAATERGLITLPGVATPTEAFAALDAGADGLKLFPAEMIPASAVAAFRTVVGPDVALCPTGGIAPDDLAGYFKAGATGFGLGGALYRPGDRASDVGARARRFVASWQAIFAEVEPET
jgi:2-dehydro-3-deoxyphosphogalactonate aldolase